ncbi:MAG: hypothetical protein IJO32_04560 [Bacilli bacterium]|nr:hypothetical protein [Bacilli bacterium]
MTSALDIATNILNNSIKSNKISHAYLFQVDGSLENNEFVFSFIKKIICMQNPNNSEIICKRIDEGNYPELKIIKPDGQWIKKEQLLELQEQFNKKAIESNRMVYLIESAEKMNSSSANTLLKFLEEPEEGIVAILLTNNIHNVIETIVSRCQIINLKNENIKENIYSEEYINNALNFIEYLEKNKINTLAQIQDLWNNKLTQKEDYIKSFDIINLIYMDVLNLKLKNNIETFKEYKEQIQNIEKTNDLNELFRKINLIIDVNDKLKYNVNINMLMDKFIIEFSGGR